MLKPSLGIKTLATGLILLGACFGGFGHGAAWAAEAPSGITLTPAFLQINLSSNETEHPIEFQITNNRPVAQTLHMSTTDFNALEDSGGLLFVGTNPSELTKKYGLAKWLSIPQPVLSLAPHQTVTVKAIILNQPDLTAGGHYGALMLALDEGTTAGSNNLISLHSIASALLFVNKIGGDIHNLILDKVDKANNLFALPSVVTLHFRNQGNTHVLPRGTVEIRGPGGRLISKGVINEGSAIILPELSRNFQVKLGRLALPVRPGHYRLSVNYRFDGYDQFRTYQTNFFLAAPVGLIVIFMGSVALFLGGYYLIKSRWHFFK